MCETTLSDARSNAASEKCLGFLEGKAQRLQTLSSCGLDKLSYHFDNDAKAIAMNKVDSMRTAEPTEMGENGEREIGKSKLWSDRHARNPRIWFFCYGEILARK